MNKRFQDKTAVITGAAQGIGRRVAERMAAEGGRLLLVDRSELIHELADELVGVAEVLTLTADLEQFAECQRVMAAALERFGRLDILINNVGGTIWAKPFEHYQEHEIEAEVRLDILINNVGGTIWAKPFEHYQEHEIEAEVRRSLFPTLWCCHAALPLMLEQGSGAIVNVSSVATRGIHRVPYGAAKGGVNALTACLAFETAERGIRVNATAPGGTEAPPRRIPRNSAEPSEQEKVWYQQIVDQSLDSS
ncbi:hypothetical protein AO268_16540, partial [Pseudomonas sp. ICMP 8385]|uniref:1,6-dihydroxycyclohexa-2,4-diene-1-carboxylate dehydrogenase n=1 Tax=Pseudomonas sp. ICMP 8385 TaxID=1718920 RepID=UPI000C06A7B0